ncbi:MAG: hypothetical protein LBU89_04210 [Fibromonadaceae bacterium]|nr:hypothetical protein [Fibromonadaceae bacterium]
MKKEPSFAEIRRILAEVSEMQKETAASQKETDQKLKELVEQVSGTSKSNGAFAENLFFHSLEKSKTFAGVHFDAVSNKFKLLKKMPDGTRLEDQFDIVMVNDDAVAIIEVKYRARSEDPAEMVEKKVPNFRTLFSDYKDFKIYLGLGSFSFDEHTTKEAERLGIGLLQISGDTVEYKTDWVRAYG